MSVFVACAVEVKHTYEGCVWLRNIGRIQHFKGTDSNEKLREKFGKLYASKEKIGDKAVVKFSPRVSL